MKPGAWTCSGSSEQTHLGVLAPQVSVHGGAGGHLGAAQVARLGLHLLVGEVHVLLQHVLRQVLLIARRTRPRLPHCHREEGDQRVTHSWQLLHFQPSSSIVL